MSYTSKYWLIALIQATMLAQPIYGIAQEQSDEGDDKKPAVKKIYKWVDEKGNVHYGDKPKANAKEIKIRNVQSVQPGQSQALEKLKQQLREEPKAKEELPEPFKYTTLTVTNPPHDQAFFSNEGIVNVKLKVEPELQAGHSMRVELNGTVLFAATRSTSITLNELERNSYQLSVTIVDQFKRDIMKHSSTFHLLKNSALNRQ
ncbi:MAG: DUF4124 domain-containing protein [Kangiellaceae bacterium]|jgi:hypothetical protein|nr:DUF4124 domain-containing protein [Kangiellaceae bacterium]